MKKSLLAVAIAAALLGAAASVLLAHDASAKLHGTWVHDSPSYYSEVFFDGAGSMTNTRRTTNGTLSTMAYDYTLKNGMLHTYRFDGQQLGSSLCMCLGDSLLFGRYVYTRK